MADGIDMADETQAVILTAALLDAQAAAAEIPAGAPGVCEDCGEYSKRLVNGLCARCRDENERRIA